MYIANYSHHCRLVTTQLSEDIYIRNKSVHVPQIYKIMQQRPGHCMNICTYRVSQTGPTFQLQALLKALYINTPCSLRQLQQRTKEKLAQNLSQNQLTNKSATLILITCAGIPVVPCTQCYAEVRTYHYVPHTPIAMCMPYSVIALHSLRPYSSKIAQGYYTNRMEPRVYVPTGVSSLYQPGEWAVSCKPLIK